MPAARLPGPPKRRSDSSSTPTAARSSWTRAGELPLSLQPKLLRAVEYRRSAASRLARGSKSGGQRDRGDQSRSAGRGGRGTVPDGLVLSAEHSGNPPRTASRTQRGHPLSDRDVRARIRQAFEAADHRGDAGCRASCCSTPRGRATSASSETSSSGRAFWRKAASSASASW